MTNSRRRLFVEREAYPVSASADFLFAVLELDQHRPLERCLYQTKTRFDGVDVLSVYLNGVPMGMHIGGPFANGFAALATTSTTAAFDNLVVTRP